MSSKKKHRDGDYYNKDVDAKRKLLTGFQMSRDTDGVEANFQISFCKKTKKHYEKATIEEKEPKEEEKE